MKSYWIGFGIACVALIWIAGAKADDGQLALPDSLKTDAPDAAGGSAGGMQVVAKQGGDKKDAEKKDDKKLDPIEKAFALPHGISVSSFNDKQKKAYDELKKRYTLKLKSYLDKIAKAPDEKDKNIAAKEMMACTREIRGEIDKILDMPAQDAAKKAQQQAQKAEQARKKAIEQAKKRRRY